MADLNQTLERECENARASLGSLSRGFAITSATLFAIISGLITFADSREISFDTAKHFAPLWVGVQLISMGIFMFYASYEKGIASTLRQASASGQKFPLTPVRLLESTTYLLMFIGSISVFFSDHSYVVYVVFGCVAFLGLVGVSMVLKGLFFKSATKEILGPVSRSKDPSKRLEHDILRLTRFTVTSAALYFVVGGLLVWLVWDGTLWATALPLSILVSIFIAVAEKNFHQYENMVAARITLHSLDRLRLERLTNVELSDDQIRSTLRSIKGLPATDKTDRCEEKPLSKSS